MTNWSKLSKEDRKYLHEHNITAKMLNDSSIKAIGFNQLGGGIHNAGVEVFDSVYDARAFLHNAPITRDIVYF